MKNFPSLFVNILFGLTKNVDKLNGRICLYVCIKRTLIFCKSIHGDVPSRLKTWLLLGALRKLFMHVEARLASV